MSKSRPYKHGNKNANLPIEGSYEMIHEPLTDRCQIDCVMNRHKIPIWRRFKVSLRRISLFNHFTNRSYVLGRGIISHRTFDDKDTSEVDVAVVSAFP